jgi:unsaturated rhamnogalacturonyl hydrolase
VHGLVLTSFDELNKKHQTKKNTVRIVNTLINWFKEDGTIHTYKLETYNIDMVVAGRLLFDLYATTKRPNI